LQGDLQKAIEESRKLAVGEYADALMAGDALPAPRRSEITQKLARLTGLSPDYIDSHQPAHRNPALHERTLAQ